MGAESHLGGYTPGGDPATWFPRLWRWAVREFGVKTAVDVGAGEGYTVEFLRMLGVDAVGVEGTPQPSEHLVEHDYTTGPYEPDCDFDLGWCCEFAEHVAAEHEQNWLATLARCRVVMFTHGEPGQDGFHHVNLRYAPYWAAAFQRLGYVFLDDETAEARREALVANPSPWNHFARSGLVFAREGG